MFRSALIASLLYFFVSNFCWGQSSTPEGQLPTWAFKKWQSISKKHSLEISTRINPFVWRGDFNDDRQSDIALFVTHTPSSKDGIVVLFSNAQKSLILGAGIPFANGGDDFSWVDSWSVEERGSIQKSYYEKTIRLKTDALLVVKEGSASALIYLSDGKAKWQQQGD